MNHNGGPERLVAQMKSLNGETDGFQILSRLKSAQKPLLIEFRQFKDFVNEHAAALGLKRSGEFYFNFTRAGFTGIVCFNGSHLSIRTQPAIDELQFEIFLSDKLLNNINLAESLYQTTIGFFASSVMEESYQSL